LNCTRQLGKWIIAPSQARERETYVVRFGVFTAVTMKNGVFWDVFSAVWLLKEPTFRRNVVPLSSGCP
jgi:hypothetical protein